MNVSLIMGASLFSNLLLQFRQSIPCVLFLFGHSLILQSLYPSAFLELKFDLCSGSPTTYTSGTYQAWKHDCYDTFCYFTFLLIVSNVTWLREICSQQLFVGLLL